MAEETGQPGVPEATRHEAGRGEHGTGGGPGTAAGPETAAGPQTAAGLGAAAGPGTAAGPGAAAGLGAAAGPGTGDGPESNGNGQERDSRRAELIAAAQARWISTLTDLGGRNTLLYYKDRRAGTLDRRPTSSAR